MEIQLRLFALYRERAGLEEARLEVPEGSTVAEALDLVRAAYPRLREMPARVLVAVNMDYVDPSQVLNAGDELALIPPVAGGSPSREDRVSIVDRAIDPVALIAEVATTAAGATVLFLGTVREMHLGREVVGLEYEAYPAMAEKKIREILEVARSRWSVCRMVVEHRHGKLQLGDIAVAVAVSAAHRDAAFEAGRHAIDALKQTAPIWKKEAYRDGEAWIDPRLG